MPRRTSPVKRTVRTLRRSSPRSLPKTTARALFIRNFTLMGGLALGMFVFHDFIASYFTPFMSAERASFWAYVLTFGVWLIWLGSGALVAYGLHRGRPVISPEHPIFKKLAK